MRCIGDAFSLCLLSDVVETGGAMGPACHHGCRSVVDVRRACRSKCKNKMTIGRNAIDSNSVSLVQASGWVGASFRGGLMIGRSAGPCFLIRPLDAAQTPGCSLLDRHQARKQNKMTPRGRCLGPEEESSAGQRRWGGEWRGGIPATTRIMTCASKMDPIVADRRSREGRAQTEIIHVGTTQAVENAKSTRSAGLDPASIRPAATKAST
ncbi:hypothetical protein BJY52DRAFT_240274 [Lactarius psammicola]|nr:hypothetical protein BJY52DRAFT_240274 [Lactarius psammicola]